MQTKTLIRELPSVHARGCPQKEAASQPNEIRKLALITFNEFESFSARIGI